MEYIILEDRLYETIYYKDEKRFYPTAEDVQELTKRIARREGIDESYLICKIETR